MVQTFILMYSVVMLQIFTHVEHGDVADRSALE